MEVGLSFKLLFEHFKGIKNFVAARIDIVNNEVDDSVESPGFKLYHR